MATTNRFSTELKIRVPQNLNGALSDRLVRAIAVLTEAAEYAERASADRWDFAVEVEQLRTLGLSNSDLRYLVTLRIVEHVAEATIASSRSRCFRHEADLSITGKSCFVLSQSKCVARPNKRILGLDKLALSSIADIKSDHNPIHVPIWDFAHRVLVFNDQVVKQFKRRANNQEVILSAFQEEGWPTRIDDPLTPQPAIEEKRRLNDAIKSLNRNQLRNLVHFRGDGSGQAIVWGP